MDEPIIVVDESATQTATETIAETVAQELTPVIAEAIADATEEDDTQWVRELLDEKLRENRQQLLTELLAVWSPTQTILENLSRIVEAQSVALALATSSQASPSLESIQTPAESEAEVIAAPIQTTEPASVADVPVEVKTETKAGRKLHRI